MYLALGGVRCPNLVRLHCRGGNSGGGSGGIHLQPDGKTVVLYLEPVGLPLQRAPPSEADLRRAVRNVLAGVVALHAAGDDEAGKGRGSTHLLMGARTYGRQGLKHAWDGVRRWLAGWMVPLDSSTTVVGTEATS